MNIALFGGTFDPIHSGHLRVAKAAIRKFRLEKVLFIPTGNPPHKIGDRLTPFADRFAMVALACASEPRFVPSLLEAPSPGDRPHYSVATVRAVNRRLRPRDRLYFLIGMDAFLDLPHWKDYRRLLDSVNFIMVTRPGFDSKDLWRVLPDELVQAKRRDPNSDEIPLRHSTLYVLRGVNESVASRGIREALRAGKSVAGLVPALVEEYIAKKRLYRSPRAGHTF